MRIDLYKIKKAETFNLARRIERIYAKDLQHRNMPHGEDQMRLEVLKKEGDLWYMDFVRIRMTQGPAKTPLSSPSTGFALKADEGFGEETAMLWNTANDYCVMQYNHHSLRPGSISDYLSGLTDKTKTVLRFLPKIDPALMAKIRSKRIVTQFTIEVAPSEIADEDYDEGLSLISAAKSFQDKGADVVTISLATRHSRGRTLNIDLEKVKDWISSIYSKTRGEAVLSASAKVKQTPGERAEPLDLLTNHITETVDVKPGMDRRLPLEARWRELFLLHETWEKYMK